MIFTVVIENSRKNQYRMLLFFRRMIRGGFRRQDPEYDEHFKLVYTNKQIHGICKTVGVCVSDFVRSQQKRYLAHLVIIV